MSCYNWENGAIVIPAKEYSKVRKAVITEYNNRQDKLYEFAKAIILELRAKGKGKRNFDFKTALFEMMDKLEEQHYGELKDNCYSSSNLSSHITDTEKWNLRGMVKLDDEGKPSKLPKKQDLDKHPISRGCRISCGEGQIDFNDKTHTVYWGVSENNRAVESANSEPLAVLLWSMLEKITWTRGSGGKIVGNDEYNRDSSYEGGGSNYVTREYRPKTKEELKAKSRYSYSCY